MVSSSKILFSRDVFYNGVNCIGEDMTSTQYKKLKTISQAQISWMSQINYGNFILYFGTVLIFTFVLKYGIYYLYDASYESDLSTSEFLRNQIILKKSDKSLKSSDWDSQKGSVDYSTTTYYRPSLIPKVTSLLRAISYRRIPPKYLKYCIPNLSLGIYVILAVCTVYVTAYTFGQRPYYRECRGFGSPPLAIRAGVMAMTCFIYIFILSGKTNLISAIVGIGYEKLYIYHKYVSWCALILSFVHTAPFIYQSTHEGGYSNWRRVFNGEQTLFLSGFVALGALCWLCLMSFHSIRKVSHEIFYHLHWSIAIVFLGTLIWHIGNSANTWRYTWALIVIWFVQLLYRVSFKTALKPNKWFLKPRICQLKSLDNETFELEVFKSGFDWTAGQHIFIRFRGKRILDNHPFTICSVPENGSNVIKLIIKSRNGLTASINDELLRATEKDFTTDTSLNKALYVDGPYGMVSRDFSRFDNAVLIANGSGVTFTLPFLKRYAQQIQSVSPIETKQKADSVTDSHLYFIRPIIKQVKFIWVIRDLKSLSWIHSELEECYRLGQGLITIDIYICGTTHKDVVANNDSDKPEEHKSAEANFNESTAITVEMMENEAYEWCNTYHFKPNLNTVVGEQLRDKLLRRNIIFCSGGSSLTNDVSNGVASLQSSIWGGAGSCVEDIYLHTESFSF